MTTLQKLLNHVDPQANEPYEPLTPADQCQPDGLVYEAYVAPTSGTTYAIGRDQATGEIVRDDRPWQLRST